jgi:hypothetical protein
MFVFSPAEARLQRETDIAIATMPANRFPLLRYSNRRERFIAN